MFFLADEQIRIIFRKIQEINLESEEDVTSAKQHKKLCCLKINPENNFLFVEQTYN